jgi:hypothetical protein
MKYHSLLFRFIFFVPLFQTLLVIPDPLLFSA